MDKFVTLKKSDFNSFITKLSQKSKVVAPVKRGVKNFAFEEVKSGENIAVTYIPTILPPKKYFMPQRETIQEFNKGKGQWTPVVKEGEKLVIFGVHTCDLAGIQFLNKVMSTDPKDANYLAHQAGISVIGLECNTYCDEYASCNVVKSHLPNGGYDLFFTELKDAFLVHVATDKGEKIVKETGVFKDAGAAEKDELAALRKKKEEIFKPEVNTTFEGLKDVFAKSYESEVWEGVGKRCVSCGNCTNVCPTCYCFDIRDELNLDLMTGERVRMWDGCQNEDFAKVAGGENFREERGDRQRHRYMRKFNYPLGKFEQYSCTGCGRCSRTCMARIVLKETINDLIKDVK